MGRAKGEAGRRGWGGRRGGVRGSRERDRVWELLVMMVGGSEGLGGGEGFWRVGGPGGDEGGWL